MTTEILDRRDPAALLEQVIIQGDLAKLQPAERVHYYRAVCQSIGVNPLTKPFEYIPLSGRLVLYAKKDCTDQLRSLHAVSILEVQPQQIGDLYVVTAKAADGAGRTDMATGAVHIKGLAGEPLANAMMKAETKAKRRVTLSLCGLGMLDESEVPEAANAERIEVDPTTGEILGRAVGETLTGPSATGPERLITDPQVKRFHAIASGSKWSKAQLEMLLRRHGIESGSATDIPRGKYDELIELVKVSPA